MEWRNDIHLDRPLVLGSVLSVSATGALAPRKAFIYNTGNDVIPAAGMVGGLDAGISDPRMIDGVDRSLVGGISWNVAGGSFASFKSQFAWAGGSTD